ncbi:MAG: hypothetical protein IAE62_03525 [Flavobacteriales bacterium]|nr:hypothetical protein [Flavobacteriales bacterium]
MMSNENKFTELSNEELQSEFATSKKLCYPAVVILLFIFAIGIYAATHGGMGFFKLILFMGSCMICFKYIIKYSNLQKEMKARDLLP